MSNEDQLCLEMNERNAERSKQQLRDKERCVGLCIVVILRVSLSGSLNNSHTCIYS